MTRKWDPNIEQYRDSGKFGGNDNVAAAGGMTALATAIVEYGPDRLSDTERAELVADLRKNERADAWERYLGESTVMRHRFLSSRGVALASLPRVDRDLQLVLAREGTFQVPSITDKSEEAAQEIAATVLEEHRQFEAGEIDEPWSEAIIEFEYDKYLDSIDMTADDSPYYTFLNSKTEELVGDLQRVADGVVTPLDVQRLVELRSTGLYGPELHSRLADKTEPISCARCGQLHGSGLTSYGTADSTRYQANFEGAPVRSSRAIAIEELCAHTAKGR